MSKYSMTMDQHVERHGVTAGLLCVSVDLATLSKHPDCTETQRELLLAARDMVWRAGALLPAKAEAAE